MGQDSRNRIAAAARAEFAEHGYAGARVARIAKRAGLNKQLIFYYFGSKAGLYAAIAEEDGTALGNIPPGPTEGEHASKQLRQELHHLTSFLIARPHVLQGMLSTAPGAESDRLVDAAIERIRRIISEGQGRGYFRDGCDPALEAGHAVALIVGHLVVEVAKGKGPDDASVGAPLANTISDLVVRNLAW